MAKSEKAGEKSAVTEPRLLELKENGRENYKDKQTVLRVGGNPLLSDGSHWFASLTKHKAHFSIFASRHTQTRLLKLHHGALVAYWPSHDD